jgi:midasin (ATPase involved in ribosome maturation)
LGLQQQGQVNQLELLQQRDKVQLNQIEQKHKDRLNEIDQLTGNQKANALAEENNKFANQKAFWDYKLTNPASSAVDPIKQVQAAKAGVAIQNTYQAEMDKAIEEGNEEKYNRAAHELSAFSQNATQAGIPSSGIQLSYSARKKATDLATRLNRVSGGILGNPQKAEDYANQLQQLRNDPSNYVLTDEQKSTLSDAQEAYDKTKNLPAIQEVLQKQGIPSNLLNIPSQQKVPSKLPAATQPAGNIPGVNVPMNTLPTTMIPAAQSQDQTV